VQGGISDGMRERERSRNAGQNGETERTSDKNRRLRSHNTNR